MRSPGANRGPSTTQPQTTTTFHPVHHWGGCGLRIPSPHPACQAWADPYLAGEIRRTTLTSTGAIRVRVLWIDCHACGVTVQHSEATA